MHHIFNFRENHPTASSKQQEQKKGDSTPETLQKGFSMDASVSSFGCVLS
jgi:hypothetical protein